MVYNDLEKVITNSKYIHRHIVPFSFSPNGNVNEYNRIFKLLNRHEKFELCTDVRDKDSDVYEYLYTLYNNSMDEINKESIGSVWKYKKSEEEQKSYYVFQEKKNAPIKLLARISDSGIYLLKTGIGLLWYEIRYYRSEELKDDIEIFEKWIRKTKEDENTENKIKVLEEQCDYLLKRMESLKQDREKVEKTTKSEDTENKIEVLKGQYDSLHKNLKNLKQAKNNAKQIKNSAERKLEKVKKQYGNLFNELEIIGIDALQELERVKGEEETISILKEIADRDVQKAILDKDEIKKIEETLEVYKRLINYLLEILNSIKVWNEKIEKDEDVNEEIEKFENQYRNVFNELEIIVSLEPEKEEILQALTKGKNKLLEQLTEGKNKLLQKLEQAKKFLIRKKEVKIETERAILDEKKQEEIIKPDEKFEGIIKNSIEELEKLICLKEVEEGRIQKTKEEVKDLTAKYEQIKKDKIENLKNIVLGFEQKNALDIKTILDFQNMFKELARPHTEIKYVDSKGNLNEGKSCVLGKWVADVLENLDCERIEYFPERKVDKDSSIYSLKKAKKANINLVDIEAIGRIPDKAILYNYVAISESAIKESGYEQESKNVLETMAYYMALGYNKTYEMDMHVREGMLHPYNNIVEFVKKEGFAECAIFKEKNKNFFINRKFINMRTDYFHMYMNLLQQSYSILNMSKELATSLPTNQESYRAGKKGISKRLEDIETRINLFLIKSVKASVSHVENQNEFYSYVENGLHIREDLDALRDGVGTLEEIQRRRESARQEKRNELMQTAFALLTILGVLELPKTLMEFLLIDVDLGNLKRGTIPIPWLNDFTLNYIKDPMIYWITIGVFVLVIASSIGVLIKLIPGIFKSFYEFSHNLKVSFCEFVTGLWKRIKRWLKKHKNKK